MKRKLYVISSNLGIVKVGVSASPSGRCADLQAIRDDKLTLVWQSNPIDNTIGVERYAHKLLSNLRHKSEWFKCTEKVAIEACTKAIAEYKPGTKRIDTARRVTIAMSSGEMEELNNLKRHLEVKAERFLSTSEVIRQSVTCLRKHEGLN